MTRSFKLSLVALCLLSLFACQNLGAGLGPRQGAPATRIDDILERGELRVGLSGGQVDLAERTVAVTVAAGVEDARGRRYSDQYVDDDDLDGLTAAGRSWFMKIGYAWNL